MTTTEAPTGRRTAHRAAAPEADPDAATGAGRSRPKRSLILAGGGMKVGYQAGVLQVLLDEAGLEFDHADGTSGGCLNLAMLNSGLSGTRIANNWRTTGPFDITSFQWPWRYLMPWRLPGLMTFKGLERRLPVWGVDFDAIHRSPIDSTYNVFNFSDKTFETHPQTDLTPDLFNACFALPIWFPPVEIDGKTYIDGVYWKDANLTAAVERGVDEIWVIWTVSETPTYRRGPYAQYFDIIEAIADGRFYEELRQIETINAAVRAGMDTTHREITVHVIRHPTPVPLDYLLFFSAGDMSRIVDMGVADARAYLAANNVPFQPTGPMAPPIGFRFRETMHGHWAKGATDPAAGEVEGIATGSPLAVHLAIAIENMDDFLADPERTASATGTVECPALGGSLEIGAGTFNVLIQTGPDARQMRYVLPFTGADGTAYTLLGVKEVADDPGFDAWRDTTTLFTRIHAGGEDGPVVGAGIIRLGLVDLARQATTLRIMRSRGPATFARTALGFSRFFMTSLWDTYVRHR
jgi:predicted patatin/cPLA2 family phospholipase